MRIPHYAVLAGLVGALALGSVAAPVTAHAEEAVSAAADAAPAATEGDGTTDDFVPESTGVSVPTDYDKADFYEAAPLANTLATARASRAGVTGATDEMRYFTLYESGQNYDQGFSRWDGYHAMGYYQFDRRYSLVPLMRYCYNYDPVTFSMFKPLIDRGAELSNASTVIFDTATSRLAEIGQLAEDAWHAAYAADPATFAALQDSYAITNYYMPTENWLRSDLGIDISGRADCVKGLVWSMSNLFGVGGVQTYLRAANLSNDMSDRAFVNALVDSLPSTLAANNPNTQYHQSWINRYEKERATCLAYIAEDEAQANQPGGNTPSGDTGTQPSGDTSTGDTGAKPGTDGPSDNTGEQPGADEPADDGDTQTGTDEPADDTGNSASSDGASGDDPADNGDNGDTIGNGGGEGNGSTDGTGDNGTGDNSTGDNGAGDGSHTDDEGGSITPGPVQPAPPVSNGATDGITADGYGSQTEGSASNGAAGTDQSGTDGATNTTTGNNGGDATKNGDTSQAEQPTASGAKPNTATGKNADAAKRLPQTGDATGFVTMATAGVAALGMASLVGAKRLASRDDEALGE